MAFTQTSFLTNLFQWRRYRIIVAALLLLILIAFGAEKIYLGYLERNWQSIQHDEEQKLAQALVSKFESFETEVFDAARETAHLPALVEALSHRDDSLAVSYFTILKTVRRQDITVEIFDPQKNLTSWSGTVGARIDTSQLFSSPHSFVDEGPLYSYLIVSVPVEQNHQVVGYVVGERLFDVNYPINNRFINKNVFVSAFTSRLDVPAQFDFSSNAKQQQNGQRFSVELHGVDGTNTGFAFLNSPQLSARTDEIHLQAQRVVNVFLIVLVCVLFFSFASTKKTSAVLNVVFWTAAIWILRFLMLWIDFPSIYIHISISDPSYFASSFGWGIAKSVGDFFITATMLFINVLLVIHFSKETLQASSSRNKFLTAIGVVILALLCCLMLRGFAATIHSVVFDSSLRFNDPMFIMPPFILSMMLLGIFLISCSVVIASVGLFFYAYRFVKVWLDFSALSIPSWLISLALFCAGSLLFGVVHPSPLLTQGERLLYIIGIVVTTILCVDIGATHFQLGKLKSFVAIVAASIVAIIPQLDKEVHLLDRSHVELIANEIVRPADSWLTFVLNRSLDELSSSEILNTLQSGDHDDIQKLAFTGWAKSILSQQGYNCTVLFVNVQGDGISDFHIGVHEHETAVQHRIENSLFSRWATVEERQSPVGNVKWYVGYAPLKDEDGDVLGGVRVELSADKRALLRGEAPEILRNYTKENFEEHNRSLLLSEFVHEKLVSTTGETMPLGRDLPNQIQKLSANNSSLWLDESVNGVSYETFFIREQSSTTNASWIGLSMEQLDVRWHLFTIIRLILFYVLVAFGGGIIFWGMQRLREKPTTVDFRTKLLFAFVIVSFIPIAVLAYYNRRYAIERAEELMIKQLSDETKIVVTALQEQRGLNAPFDVSRLTNAQCEDIANNLGTDFNVYANGTLLASSKPEVFFAELLPSRLSEDAFFNVSLKKQAFYSEQQSIGTMPYIVGHRPIFSESGSVIGIVSVPSLYRQQEIDEEIMQRNAFLFGAYAFALVISIVLGTIFANQISFPLRRLRQATQRVASGDLSPPVADSLDSRRTDEFGELERAFERMTIDLKQAQDEMARAQRELAWKEMAQQVAHEIKNPLTPMKLSIQHLRQAYQDKAKNFEELLHRISQTLLEQVETLSRIASEFSQFARMPKRNIQQCDIHTILQETRNLFQQYPKINLDLQLKASNVLVNADKEELQRAFINVIRNAVQAMNEHGKISVETKSIDGNLEIRIVDTGPGIPEEIRTRLFQPNFSTKTDGMGLGLTIVKQTVDALGGSIFIESEFGKGTTVRIQLPVGQKSEVRDQTSA